MLGQAGSSLADLRPVSDSLVREVIGFPGGPEPTIGRIEVDISNALGTERIFAASFLDWLARSARLRVSALPGESAAPEARSHLEAALAPRLSDPDMNGAIADREAAAALLLRLPSDALPSLSAIFSRRLPALPPGHHACGVHALADPVTCRPELSVAYPPLDDVLMRLQPRYATIPPHLTATGPSIATGATENVELPLAIRFPHATPDSDAVALRQVAADKTSFPLRSEPVAEAGAGIAVSVVVAGQLRPAEAVLFLESLALQTMAARIEVLCPTPQDDAEGASGLRACLERLFPARHRLLPASTATPNAMLNVAARAARGAALLLACEPLLLVDHRVLGVLHALLGDPLAATASCTLTREIVQTKGQLLAVQPGGLFPSHIALHALPRLAFRQIESSLAMPPATYPVIGNPFRLTLVRRSAWQQLNGLDTTRFPAEHADVDFCLRAVRGGWRHLSTSAVSAVSLAGPAAQEVLDPLGAAFLPVLQWQEVAAAATIVRALR